MTRNDIFRIACLAAVLMAGSCAAPVNDTSVWADGARNHPITVEPDYRAMLRRCPLPAASGAGRSARMDAFVRDYLERGNGAISISVPRALQDANAAISANSWRRWACRVRASWSAHRDVDQWRCPRRARLYHLCRPHRRNAATGRGNLADTAPICRRPISAAPCSTTSPRRSPIRAIWSRRATWARPTPRAAPR